MDDLTSSLHSLEQQHLASSFQWGIFPSTWHDMLLIVRKVILSISQSTHYVSLFAWVVLLCVQKNGGESSVSNEWPADLGLYFNKLNAMVNLSQRR